MTTWRKMDMNIVPNKWLRSFYFTLIDLKMKRGSLDEEEKEKLLDFDKKHNGKPTTNEWKELALDMGRQSKHLQDQLKILKQSKDVSQTLKNSLKMK